MLAVVRTIIATVLCVSLTVAGFAQDAFAPDRIRLRGVRAYEIPGVMAMAPNSVTGSAITVTGSEIHVLRPAPNPVLTVDEERLSRIEHMVEAPVGRFRPVAVSGGVVAGFRRSLQRFAELWP
jgi:hypothetical protein